MITTTEVKRNLLGSLEAALFMPSLRSRFGTSRDEAVRSFFVPILLFPLTMLVMRLPARLMGANIGVLELLFCLRMALSWGLFLGSVYWLARQIGRREHFCQFVIMSNWLSVPAALAFAPAGALLISGAQTWDQTYPFMLATMGYTYAFTAYATAKVLRLPWQTAGLIAMIAFCADNCSQTLLNVVSLYL